MKKSPVLAVLRHPSAFVRFLRDREAPLFPRIVALLSLLYVISPIDAIPDTFLFVGWLDDIGVIAMVLAWTAKRVAEYVPKAIENVVVKQA